MPDENTSRNFANFALGCALCFDDKPRSQALLVFNGLKGAKIMGHDETVHTQLMAQLQAIENSNGENAKQLRSVLFRAFPFAVEAHGTADAFFESCAKISNGKGSNDDNLYVEKIIKSLGIEIKEGETAVGVALKFAKDISTPGELRSHVPKPRRTAPTTLVPV